MYVITTITNNKLFIHFDEIIKTAKVVLQFSLRTDVEFDISNTEFESIEIPENSNLIRIEIISGKKKYERILSVNSQTS